MIPYGRQEITDQDVAAVVEVLRSDFLTQGPAVPLFEDAVLAQVGVDGHAIAMNSATSALHVACLALGVGPGDLVWTVPNTFVASANCARHCGAEVGFVDIEPDTWNMSPEDLERRLIKARAAGRLPKVVIPVHFSGQPTDMPRMAALAEQFGFALIEDASHAIGATLQGVPVGDGRWSAITIFSFHPVKIVTTAEGGMAVTRDAALADRMRSLRSHGITREPQALSRPSRGAWYYEQHELGFNYRMTDLQAALGTSQMTRLRDYVQRRNALAARYDQLLVDLPVMRPTIRPDRVSAFHLYVVRLFSSGGATRDEVFTRMRERGIGVNVHYAPVHLQPYYQGLGFAPGLCPEAEAYGEDAITLPLYPTMTEAEQDHVVAALQESL